MAEDRPAMRGRIQLTMAVLALAAACAVIASPWTRIAPLSSGLNVWLVSVLPNWAEGSVVMAYRETATSVGSVAARLIPLSIVFALPFFGLSKDAIGRVAVVAGRLTGVLVLALAVPVLFTGAASTLGEFTMEGVLILMGSALAGSLLLVLGVCAIRDGHKRGSPSQQTFGVLAGLSGICLVSILLLPVGLILLVPTYLMLAACQFRSTWGNEPLRRRSA